MIYNIFVLLGLLALLSLVFAILPKNAWFRTIMSAFAMGLFAILALSAHNVTKVYVDYGSTIPQHIVQFEPHDAVAIANLLWLMFIVSLVMLIVNTLLTFNTEDLKIGSLTKKEPKWKKFIGFEKRW